MDQANLCDYFPIVTGIVPQRCLMPVPEDINNRLHFIADNNKSFDDICSDMETIFMQENLCFRKMAAVGGYTLSITSEEDNKRFSVVISIYTREDKGFVIAYKSNAYLSVIQVFDIYKMLEHKVLDLEPYVPQHRKVFESDDHEETKSKSFDDLQKP